MPPCLSPGGRAAGTGARWEQKTQCGDGERGGERRRGGGRVDKDSGRTPSGTQRRCSRTRRRAMVRHGDTASQGSRRIHAKSRKCPHPIFSPPMSSTDGKSQHAGRNNPATDPWDRKIEGATNSGRQRVRAGKTGPTNQGELACALRGRLKRCHVGPKKLGPPAVKQSSSERVILDWPTKDC